MKGLFLVVILGVLSYANAKSGKCSCGVFLRDGSTNHPVADSRVFSAEDKDLEDCGDAGKTSCEKQCYDTIDKLTDGGKLDHKDKDGKSVADIACTRLAKNIVNGELGSFVKVCGGEWQFTHGTTPKHLCCQDKHSVAC